MIADLGSLIGSCQVAKKAGEKKQDTRIEGPHSDSTVFEGTRKLKSR